MKRKTAKEILAESFRELSMKKAVDKITVKEITDNCGYSPATFYRQFRDKYDLIAWNYSQELSTLIDRISVDGSWEQMLLPIAQWFHTEKSYLANLLSHTSGQDAFIHYMVEIHQEVLKKCIQSNASAKVLDKSTNLYIRIYCLGAVHLTSEWILGRYPVLPEELSEIYRDALPEPLKPYLC